MEAGLGVNETNMETNMVQESTNGAVELGVNETDMGTNVVYESKNVRINVGDEGTNCDIGDNMGDEGTNCNIEENVGDEGTNFNREALWTKYDVVDLQSPPIKIQLGSPKKKRNREAGEMARDETHLKQEKHGIKCSHCHKDGHNKSTCRLPQPQAPPSQVPKITLTQEPQAKFSNQPPQPSISSQPPQPFVSSQPPQPYILSQLPQPIVSSQPPPKKKEKHFKRV
ncbi:hypothetical protein KIW84_065816 [Lathyrus oleraceus]|uniref:Uncharacterized protein n=1 Tax=Pisum sativum TaxID=3888 RepID=A0A9D4WGH6_PEA|nr:hypothetical protein KIW84_065816 [Pisum sativum]